MKVYLVRHAQTIGNASRTHQTPNTPLSEIGQQQITRVANRFKTIPIDVIIASPYTRTQQTAQEISNITGKKIITTPLLRVTERPSEIHNKNINDPDVIKIKDEIEKHINEPDWHYSDEENFYDLLERDEKGEWGIRTLNDLAHLGDD